MDEPISIRDQAVYFCPAKKHHVQAHTGDRLSLVAHLHPGWHDGIPAHLLSGLNLAPSASDRARIHSLWQFLQYVS